MVASSVSALSTFRGVVPFLLPLLLRVNAYGDEHETSVKAALANVSIPLIDLMPGSDLMIALTSTLWTFVRDQINLLLGGRGTYYVVASLIILTLFATLFLTRELWYPTFHEHSFAQCHCTSIREWTCVGWLASHLCSCCYGSYHPRFRLRVLVHEVSKFHGANALYVKATCGNNPEKTTSIKDVPHTWLYPIVWNEPLDMDVQISDESITLQLMNPNHDVVGKTVLLVSHYYYLMKGSLDRVLYTDKAVVKPIVDSTGVVIGNLSVSLYATNFGEPLPDSYGGEDQPFLAPK